MMRSLEKALKPGFERFLDESEGEMQKNSGKGELQHQCGVVSRRRGVGAACGRCSGRCWCSGIPRLWQELHSSEEGAQQGSELAHPLQP